MEIYEYPTRSENPGGGAATHRGGRGRCEHLGSVGKVYLDADADADVDGKHLPLHKSAVCAGLWVSITSIPRAQDR